MPSPNREPSSFVDRRTEESSAEGRLRQVSRIDQILDHAGVGEGGADDESGDEEEDGPVKEFWGPLGELFHRFGGGVGVKASPFGEFVVELAGFFGGGEAAGKVAGEGPGRGIDRGGEGVACGDDGGSFCARLEEETTAGGAGGTVEGIAHFFTGEQEDLKDLGKAFHRHGAAGFAEKGEETEYPVDAGGGAGGFQEEDETDEEKGEEEIDKQHGLAALQEGVAEVDRGGGPVHAESAENGDGEGGDGDCEVDEDEWIGESFEDFPPGAVDAGEVGGKVAESFVELPTLFRGGDDFVFQGGDGAARFAQGIADALSLPDSGEDAFVDLFLGPGKAWLIEEGEAGLFHPHAGAGIFFEVRVDAAFRFAGESRHAGLCHLRGGLGMGKMRCLVVFSGFFLRWCLLLRRVLLQSCFRLSAS